MTNDDLKQIAELLDEKLEKAVSDIAGIVNTAFSEFEEKTDRRFDKIEEELSQKPTSDKIFSWADGILVPVSRDVDRLKYLHMKEFKDMPDNLTINTALIDEGIN